MKGKWISKLLENKKLLKTGCGLMAAAVVFGGGLFIYQSQQTLPELPVFVDGEQTVILDEEVPLASAPKVTTKTTTKKTVKNVKLKVASAKTQTKKLPTKINTKTTTKNSSTQTVKTVVKTTTTTTEQYTKKSKVKKVTTVVKTVTTTTTTQKEQKKAATETKSATPVAAAAAEEPPVKKTLDINVAAVMAHANVRSAYSELGFTVEVDSTVNYSGKFDARARKIILKKECDDIYHELGHFITWLGGIGVGVGGDGYNVYTQEKDLYVGTNKAYVTQNADEYMAEAYRDYLQNPSKLQAERPQTYAIVEKALTNIDDTRVALIKKLYR